MSHQEEHIQQLSPSSLNVALLYGFVKATSKASYANFLIVEEKP
jgi:hypothetical protein